MPTGGAAPSQEHCRLPLTAMSGLRQARALKNMINELKLLLDKYEDEALNAANAVTHVQLLGGTTRVTPSVVALGGMIDAARSAASGGGYRDSCFV